MTWVRVVLFTAAILALIFGYLGETFSMVLIVGGWLAAGGFLVAIVYHEHLRLNKLQLEAQQRLYRRLLARLDRDWDQIPEQILVHEFSELTFADDLDVAGRASLLGLLSLAGTLPGKTTLQRWIATTPQWHDVRQRQVAVQALRDRRALRLEIIQTIAEASDGTEDVYGLPRWADTEDWLASHRLAWALSYGGPGCLLLGAVVTAIASLYSLDTWLNVGVVTVGIGLVVNLLVTMFWGSWIHDLFQQVTGQHRAVFQFASVFEAFDQLPADQGLLDHIRTTATTCPTAATIGFRRLLWTVRLATLQRDPVLYVLYLVLQLTILWDFRILRKLESWKRQFGPHVAEWFEQLGVCEALVSGGTLADEYRDWTFPTTQVQDNVLFAARQLGHPLLPDAQRVANDVMLNRDKPLLLVTGSNMAGKSTFMRAVGLNLLLARTGSPVCAAELASPLYELATSIRVRDSLRDGVSFFMAELHRLKEVVDIAQLRHSQADHPLMFLLDEILQGTNSQERQIAVASVLDRLLAYGACGLVSTHDLDLATAPRIESVRQVVHFREYFEGSEGHQEMRFDYRLRPGPTPTTNALKLLQLVGLDAEGSE